LPYDFFISPMPAAENISRFLERIGYGLEDKRRRVKDTMARSEAHPPTSSKYAWGFSLVSEKAAECQP
jgi:hypothetical protein